MEKTEEKTEEKTKVLDNDDLRGLFCKKAENEGIWFQVEDKEENLWDIDVLVFGNDSDVVQKYLRKNTKEKLKSMKIGKKGKIEFDDKAIDSALDDEIEPALVRFGGIRKHSTQTPLNIAGKEIPMLKDASSAEIYRGIIEGSPDISEFVTKKAAERSSFLATGKKS